MNIPKTHKHILTQLKSHAKAHLKTTHATLPKIAVRETVRKIKPGNKNK